MRFTKKAKSFAMLSLSVLMILSSVTGCSSKSGDNVTPDEATPQDTLISIGVISSDNSGKGEDIYSGFVQSLTNEGYVDGENIKLDMKKAADAEECKKISEEIVSSEPDLIFAIGEDAAKSLKEKTDSIPVIFAGVSDPIEAGLLNSCEKPDKNFTGVSDYIPVYQQLEFAKTIISGAKKFTILYCGTDESSILTASLAAEESKKLSMKCTPFTASTEREFNSSLTKALDDTDFLYLPEDTLTTAKISDVLKAASKSKVPVISTSSKFVDSGALATTIHDYEEIGLKAGKMASMQLQGLKTVSQMPVVFPDVCLNVVNGKTLGTLKLTVPEDIKNTIVIDE